MTVFEAVVLGIVQGITEFVPISSTTHLIVVPALLGWDPPTLSYIILLHFGTLAGLLAYFYRDLYEIARDVVTSGHHGRRRAGQLVVASIPAGLAGLLFYSFFEDLLRHPAPAATALLATAALLFGAEVMAGGVGKRLARPVREEIRWRDAVAMGLAQVLALFPGVSRSGSTMAAGISGGVSRSAAAQFSFLMAIVAIGGASVLEIPDLLREGFGAVEVWGFVSAAVSSYLAVWWMLRFLKRFNFLPFAAYCLVFAVVASIILW